MKTIYIQEIQKGEAFNGHCLRLGLLFTNSELYVNAATCYGLLCLNPSLLSTPREQLLWESSTIAVSAGLQGDADRLS